MGTEAEATAVKRRQDQGTWFQAGSPSDAADYIYNDRYQQIAKLRAAHGSRSIPAWIPSWNPR